MKSKLKKTSERTFTDEAAGTVAAKVGTELREDVANELSKLLRGIVDGHIYLIAKDESAGKAVAAEGDEFDAYKGKDIAVGRASLKAIDKEAKRILALERALAEYHARIESILQELLEERLAVKDGIERAAE